VTLFTEEQLATLEPDVRRTYDMLAEAAAKSGVELTPELLRDALTNLPRGIYHASPEHGRKLIMEKMHGRRRV
jgi:hypothetical protein